MVFLVGFVDKKIQYSVPLAISLQVCFKAVLIRGSKHVKFHNLRTAVYYNVESSADVSHVNEAEFLWWFSVIR